MAGLVSATVVFVALCIALAGGAAWRLRHPSDDAAASGYRAALWLLIAGGASMALRIGGIV